MATVPEAEGLAVATTGPGVTVVVMAEVVSVNVLVLLTKDCDPTTGESSLLSSSSLIIKYLS